MAFEKRNLREAWEEKQKKEEKKKKREELKGKISSLFHVSSEKTEEKHVVILEKLLEKEEKKELQEEREVDNANSDVGTLDKKNSFDEVKEKKKKRSFLFNLFFGIFLFGISGFLLFQTFSDRSFSEIVRTQVVKTVGEDLKKDEYGKTNILLLGIGGEGHSGENLTDSIILVSLDVEKKTVSMLSLPRDFWVSYRVHDEKRSGRINEIYRDNYNYWKRNEQEETVRQKNSLYPLRKVVEEITGQEIHYTTLIDFKGFVKAVDALGGIDVVLEKAIHDSTYPGPNYTYTTFKMAEGPHHLDGETALKYARSRHNSSDFERSKRQKQILVSMKEKGLESGILTSPEKLQEFFDIFKAHFWNDFSWQEMVTLVEIASEIDKKNIISLGVNNDPEKGSGGFLFTPLKELYGGASVLRPFLDMETDEYVQIRFFAEVLFHYPEFLEEPYILEVLNASHKEGRAKAVAQHLERYGMMVKNFANAENEQDETEIHFVDTEKNRALVEVLQRKIEAKLVPSPAIPVPVTSGENASPRIDNSIPTNKTIQIFIGNDFSDNPYNGNLIRRPLPKKESASVKNVPNDSD